MSKIPFEINAVIVIILLEELKKTLNLIEYKCWYYQEAVKRGTDKDMKNLDIDSLPIQIKNLYIKAHKV